MMGKAAAWLLLVFTFVAGVAAGQSTRGSVTMRAMVRSANTIEETIEYWELRDADGNSVTVVGPKTVPLIAWLRQARGATVSVTIARDEGAQPSAD